MRVTELELPGVLLVELDRHIDERGSFLTIFDPAAIVPTADPIPGQLAMATNRRAGTLRGLHLQAAPYGQTKVMWCVRGRLFDVLVDLRPNRPSFGRWLGVELSGEGNAVLYSPPGFAHGYLTLADDTEVVYLLGGPYRPDAEIGVRWDDPQLDITWPTEPVVMSDRDGSLPFLSELQLA